MKKSATFLATMHGFSQLLLTMRCRQPAMSERLHGDHVNQTCPPSICNTAALDAHRQRSGLAEMAGLFTNLQQGKILTDMQSKAAHSLHEEVSISCEMMAIQEVFQAGLIHGSESVAKAQVHADDNQEAFLPAALSDILLLASILGLGFRIIFRTQALNKPRLQQHYQPSCSLVLKQDLSRTCAAHVNDMGVASGHISEGHVARPSASTIHAPMPAAGNLNTPCVLLQLDIMFNHNNCIGDRWLLCCCTLPASACG